MNYKKLLALVLAMVMVLSVLAGCNAVEPAGTTEGKKDPTNPQQTTANTTEPTEDNSITFPWAEPLNITAMVTQGNAAYSLSDNVAWKYLQDRANINIEVTEFAPSDVKEKANLLMNGGEYTDIIFKVSALDANKYGMDGILIPLEDLIREYAPNLTALLDERNGWAAITAPDGHIYSLPVIQKSAGFAQGGMTWWINKAWLDAVGMDMPSSTEELYAVLKAFKEKDPNGNGKADEIPLGSYNTHTAFFSLLGYFGYGMSYNQYWEVVDGKTVYMPTTEFFRDNLLKLFNTLWSEGLMNDQTFTMSRDQMRGVCGGEEVIYGMIWDSTPAYFADSDEGFNWVPLQPFDKSKFSVDTGITAGGFSITDKCQNPEVMMAWVDYLYSEEGGRVVRMGVEDVTYKINADGTYEMIKDGFENVTYQGTLMGSATVPFNAPELFYTGPASAFTRYTNDLLYGENGVFADCVMLNTRSFTTEEQEEYDVLYADINTYMRNYFAECVSGIISIDDTWADFQKTLKEMGVERMTELMQAAYDRVAID